MPNCPWCDAENISGVDTCEDCGQPLDDLHLIQPGSRIERSLLADRIGILEPRPAITVRPEATVDETLQLMAQHRIGCVLVVADDGLQGIFSERDVILRIGPQIDNVRNRPISEFMTSKVQTLDVGAKIAYAVHMMDVGNYRHIPIIRDDESLLGIVSVRDILRYLTARMTVPAA